MAKPKKRQIRQPPKKISAIKKKKLQVAVRMLTKVTKMASIKRSNMLAYLEKRGVKMSTDDLETACLALAQNMAHERLGQEKRFPFSSQEEGNIWRQISRFIEVVNDARRLRLF